MSQATLTAEEQFCVALKHFVLHPPPIQQVEVGHRQGQSHGMVVFDVLHDHIPLGSLDIDRFATHLVQLTGNQLKIRQATYWMGKSKSPDEALVVLSCSGNRPVSLAKLLETIQKSSTSLWLKKQAGELH